MSFPRRIGIIGGMGPEATVVLMQRIIAATDARDDADHIPMIVDNNPQIPSRIDALIHGKAVNPGKTIGEIAARLESYGAEVLIMPCNTAHHYASDITSSTSIPFLNMVTLSAEIIARETSVGSKIGILASPAGRQVGLFDRALTEVGRSAIYPANEERLLVAIQNIKRYGPDEISRTILADATAELAQNGATRNLVACSEFSLIADAAHGAVPVIDTLDVLVANAIRFSLAATSNPETLDNDEGEHGH